jgi:alkaline phosphatase D
VVPALTRRHWNRRELLRAAGSIALVGVADLAVPRRARAEPNVFPLSVASGDPTATGAVVWTKLAPAAIVAGRDVVLEVASDAAFGDVVARERIPASELHADRDWTVRFDLDGRLAPDRHYAYRFAYGKVRSPTGRLRTLPAPDAAPPTLRIALAACQDYARGFFNAYDDVAREELDYILHVGDFLYESFVPLRSRRRIALPSGAHVAQDLADFRALHRTYRSDPALQRALERHTLIAIWDDHDVANDRYWDRTENRLRAPDHPLDGDPRRSDAMHAGGIRAWWEYLPLRAPYDAAAASPRDRLRLTRSFRFGTLADLFVTDERLWRDGHPCGERHRVNQSDAMCPGRTAAGRTMLGDEQRRWVVDGLASSRARWKLWANSVPLTPVGFGSGVTRVFLTVDEWTGYAHERGDILHELATRNVRNLVSLTGDLHTFFAARLHADEVYPGRENSPPVGVELATGAISAVKLGELAGASVRWDVVRPNNPQLAFWNAMANGYSFVEVTPEAVVYEARGFAVDRRAEPATREVLGRCRVADGVADVGEI